VVYVVRRSPAHEGNSRNRLNQRVTSVGVVDVEQAEDHETAMRGLSLQEASRGLLGSLRQTSTPRPRESRAGELHPEDNEERASGRLATRHIVTSHRVKPRGETNVTMSR